MNEMLWDLVIVVTPINKFSSYRSENILHLHYKDQSFKLFREIMTVHCENHMKWNCTPWRNCAVFIVKTGSTYRHIYLCALNELIPKSSGSQSSLYRPWGEVDLRKGYLRQGEEGGVGGGPLRARCSLIYDRTDFRPDTDKLVSLHQAYPSH